MRVSVHFTLFLQWIPKTGSGKTASYTLPLINNLWLKRVKRGGSLRTLILLPTRELVLQVEEYIKKYSKYLNLKVVSVLGGVKINPQMQRLRGGTDILIATPGRLLDLIDRNAIKLNSLETLVLDEADKLLGLGFQNELNSIIKLLPLKRQSIMVSATFSQEVSKLSEKLLSNPVEVRIEDTTTTPLDIDKWLYSVDASKKNKVLVKLLRENRWDRVLIFVKSQNRVERLQRYLTKNRIKSETIHGKKSQSARNTALNSFKNSNTKILIATDLASRGIHIDSLPVVINYDLPQVPHNYIHRIGRTGRAGEKGVAISLASFEEFELLVKIEREIQEHIERRTVPGFEPLNELPSSPKIKPKKPKKPKKKKLNTLPK